MASTFGSSAARSDELDHRIERVERVMQQHVAVGQFGEQARRRGAFPRLPRGERRIAERISLPGRRASSMRAVRSSMPSTR